jgi:hypothetical protein
VSQFLFERWSVTPRAKTRRSCAPASGNTPLAAALLQRGHNGVSMSNEINRADGGLGWLLRAHYDGLAREPLPQRWKELICTLDEKQRLKLKTDMSMEAEGKEDPTRM